MGMLDFLNRNDIEDIPNLMQPEEPKKVSDGPHEWELISKTYAPPRRDLKDVPPALVEKAMFGVTTLLWECKLTGETKREEILGSDENQFDEMCANAATFGPQYIEREDGVYIVAKWQVAPQQPPQQPPQDSGLGNIPLR